MQKFKTFYENIIIDNIDFEGYGINNDCYLYDKIKTLYNIFKSEYVHENNKHINETILFRDWLQGLPSVLTVPFMNYEILENAKKANLLTCTTILNGIETKNVPSTGAILEKQEDRFLSQYWDKLAIAFFTLKNNL